jgi:hypothetical protein
MSRLELLCLHSTIKKIARDKIINAYIIHTSIYVYDRYKIGKSSKKYMKIVPEDEFLLII